MKPSLIIPRIRSLCPILAGRVAGAAAFAEARETDDLAVPCAFVIPGGDTAGEELLLGGPALQDINDTFSVVVCVSNLADERGQAGAEQLHDIRAELIAALLGFVPSLAYDAITYTGSGDELEVNRARIWHSYDFACVTRIST